MRSGGTCSPAGSYIIHPLPCIFVDSDIYIYIWMIQGKELQSSGPRKSSRGTNKAEHSPQSLSMGAFSKTAKLYIELALGEIFIVPSAHRGVNIGSDGFLRL